MKTFLIALLIPCSAFAWSRRIDLSASSTVPTSYSRSDSNSLILSEFISPNSNIPTNLGTNIMFLTTAHEVVCNYSTPSSLVNPAATDKRDIYLVASEPVILRDVKNIKAVFCKSNGAAIRSGWLSVTTW